MKKTAKSLVLAWITLFCFSTCQQNEEIIEPETRHSMVEEVDLGSDLHLQRLVQGINDRFHSNGRVNSALKNVDFSQASKYYDSANQVTKYTFSVNNDDEYAMQNFILMEPDHGEVFGLIFTHQLDLEWYSQFDEFPGWDQFTGTFRIQNIEGKLISESRIENGKSIESTEENGRTAGTTCVTEYILHQRDWYVNGVYDWTEYWITTETTCYETNTGGGGASYDPTRDGVYDQLDPNSDVVRPRGSDFSKPSCGANSSYSQSTSSCECYEGFVKDENGKCMSEADAWEEEVCMNEGFANNDCVVDIWETIKQNDVAYDAIKRYLANSNKLSLCLDIKDLQTATENPNGNAAPIVTKKNGVPIGVSVTINLNSKRLGRSKLSIARTLLHEMYHAKLMEMLIHANEYDNYETYAASYQGQDDFLTLWNYYQEHGDKFSTGSEDFHHEYMAQNYIDDIADGLKLLHPFLSSQRFIDYRTGSFVGNSDKPWDWDEFFVAIAWQGLEGKKDKDGNLIEPTQAYKEEVIDKGLKNDYEFFAAELKNMETSKCE